MAMTGDFECKKCGRFKNTDLLEFCPTCGEPVELKKICHCSVGLKSLDDSQELESYLFSDRYNKI